MNDPPRLSHVHGAWLLAADVRDEPRLAARRLAQHQIAAHRSWGCSAGLEVWFDAGVVTVHSGFGVDRCGRVAVLERLETIPVAEGVERVVVLETCGDGPRAAVRLREPDRVGAFDIRLARLDTSGLLHRGDGDRDWLRRPGPIRHFAGMVERGAPAAGTSLEWTTQVDLSAHRLPAAPTVVGRPAGAAASPISGTTVDVTAVRPLGFTLSVRHTVASGTPVSGTALFTAPLSLAWMALLPAERPALPNPEEWQ